MTDDAPLPDTASSAPRSRIHKPKDDWHYWLLMNDETEFHATFHGYVFGVCCWRGLKHRDAEEVTQDVFVKAFRARKTFLRKDSTVTTWITRITDNRVIDFWRSRAHNEGAVNDPVEDKDRHYRLRATIPSPEARAIHRERTAALKDCIEALKDPDDRLLMRGLIAELTLEEIGRKFDIKKSAAHTRKEKTFRLVKKCLEKKGINQ